MVLTPLFITPPTLQLNCNPSTLSSRMLPEFGYRRYNMDVPLLATDFIDTHSLPFDQVCVCALAVVHCTEKLL
ncbi:hypothetical protein I79_001937 [Cricetulus griseus]|uniref:Uncharacterized protein n=1 Tax=Cricetulus griseus TaxID=10029 RepID=G3GW26_CRIGR|nr:hypothetical protein I79_001937 [Cricetulus griseus]